MKPPPLGGLNSVAVESYLALELFAEEIATAEFDDEGVYDLIPTAVDLDVVADPDEWYTAPATGFTCPVGKGGLYAVEFTISPAGDFGEVDAHAIMYLVRDGNADVDLDNLTLRKHADGTTDSPWTRTAFVVFAEGEVITPKFLTNVDLTNAGFRIKLWRIVAQGPQGEQGETGDPGPSVYSNPGSGAGSETFGLDAVAAGDDGTAFGNGADSGEMGVAVGSGAVADAFSVAVGGATGEGAATAVGGSVAIGAGAQASNGGTAIGAYAVANEKVQISANQEPVCEIDSDDSATQTGLLVLMDGGVMTRVLIGPNDTGGSGYRALRIPNTE